MPKEYVCSTCSGRGTSCRVDADGGCVEEDKCGSCVGRGLPPRILVPIENEAGRSVIDVVTNPCAEVEVDTSLSGRAEILPTKGQQ